MYFTVFFYFALLNFLSDSLILMVRSPTPWFQKSWKSNENLIKNDRNCPQNTPQSIKKSFLFGGPWPCIPLEYFLTLSFIRTLTAMWQHVKLSDPRSDCQVCQVPFIPHNTYKYGRVCGEVVQSLFDHPNRVNNLNYNYYRTGTFVCAVLHSAKHLFSNKNITTVTKPVTKI